MVRKIVKKEFDKLYELMQDSFPFDEYRNRNEQFALFEQDCFSAFGLFSEQGDLNAFITLWNFSDFAFIEHFAVKKQLRGCGVGSKFLTEIISVANKRVCLEVELPKTEIAKRRIGFYERNKFYLNNYPYVQPPISEGKKIVPLMIMTTGGKISEKTFRKIRDNLYLKVYKTSLDRLKN